MANKTLCTPAPWYYKSGEVWAVKNGRAVVIARADREAGNGTEPVERDANMHLCAAAPELFEKIKAIVEQADAQHRAGDMYCTLGTAFINDLRAAIAKAEGK